MSWEHDLCYLYIDLTDILDLWNFNSYSCNKQQNGKFSWKHDFWYLCTELTETRDFTVFEFIQLQ